MTDQEEADRRASRRVLLIPADVWRQLIRDLAAPRRPR